MDTASSGLDSVFFRHSLVPFLVMRKTKEYCEIDEAYFNRIVKSLKMHSNILAVFDNVQIRIQQKFQRDWKSSLFLKMTAEMFVKMQYHWKDGHDLKHDQLSFIILITFLDQIIISPFGMPQYETILDKLPVFAILNYNDECYSPFHGSDTTCTRAAAYIDHVYLVEEFLKHNNDFPHVIRSNFSLLMQGCPKSSSLQRCVWYSFEDLYGHVPFDALQATRENCMQAIHTGNGRDRVPMAQWALDALMELLQIKYKVMNFPNSCEVVGLTHKYMGETKP
jgi:hypothetical protein